MSVGVNTGFSANINWPLVAGLGLTAAVLFYALYIVNGQLNAIDSAATTLSQAASNAASAITSPLQTIQNWFSDPSGSDN
jgi:threonine/homoserine efflux transporter RhtA